MMLHSTCCRNAIHSDATYSTFCSNATYRCYVVHIVVMLHSDVT